MSAHSPNKTRRDNHRVRALAGQMRQPWQAVFELGWCVFASKEYAVLYGLPKTPEDLRDHRLVLYTETRHHLTGFGGWSSTNPMTTSSRG